MVNWVKKIAPDYAGHICCDVLYYAILRDFLSDMQRGNIVTF